MRKIRIISFLLSLSLIICSLSLTAEAADCMIEDFNGAFQKSESGTYTGWSRGVSDSTVNLTTESDLPLETGINYLSVMPSDYAMTETLICKSNAQYYISGWVCGSPAAVKIESHTTEIDDPEAGTYVYDNKNSKSYNVGAEGWTHFELVYKTAENTRDFHVLFRATGDYSIKYAKLQIEERIVPPVTSWTLRSVASQHSDGGVFNEPYVAINTECDNWTEAMNCWPELESGKAYTFTFWSRINIDDSKIRPCIRVDAYSKATGEDAVQNRFDFNSDNIVETREFGYKNGVKEEWEKSDGDILDTVNGYKTFSSPETSDVGIWKENSFSFVTPDYGTDYERTAIRIYIPTKVVGGELDISGVSLKEQKSSVSITDSLDNPLPLNTIFSDQTMKLNYQFIPEKAVADDMPILFTAAVYENTQQAKNLISINVQENTAKKDYTSAIKSDYIKYHLMGAQESLFEVPIPVLKDGTEYTVSITTWIRNGEVLKPINDKYTFTTIYHQD